MTAKQQVQALLGQLPDDCSLHDIQSYLYAYSQGWRMGSREANGAEPAKESEGARTFAAWQRAVGI